MRLQFLGTGDVGQVPVFRCGCAACGRARAHPRWRRRPCSALIECAGQRWLIDAGGHDLAERCEANAINGILLTHYHADHAQGLLHLRWGVGEPLAVHGPVDEQGLADLYKHPGILDFSQPLRPLEQRQFGALQVTAIGLRHSQPCLGFVFSQAGRHVAYLTDTVGLPPESRAHLQTLALDYCIVDCTHPPQARPPRNHNDLNTALAMCEGLNIGQLVLTHVGHELDAWLMAAPGRLAAQVRVAMDGDEIRVGE